MCEYLTKAIDKAADQVRNGTMKLIHITWFTREKCFGIAIGEDQVTKKRKAYIGIVEGKDEKIDAYYLLQNGSKISVGMLEEIIMILRKEE